MLADSGVRHVHAELPDVVAKKFSIPSMQQEILKHRWLNGTNPKRCRILISRVRGLVLRGPINRMVRLWKNNSGSSKKAPHSMV
jgi:hypothetical protein